MAWAISLKASSLPSLILKLTRKYTVFFFMGTPFDRETG